MGKIPPSHVVSLYREMLRRARSLGGEQGRGLIISAKETFGGLRAQTTAEGFEVAVADAESRLSYLRVITPRFAVVRSGKSATGKFVLRDGEMHESAPAERGPSSQGVVSAFGGSNVDPDAVRRHQHLVERQHFGGDFWRGKR
jgi:hypothetical protein